MSQKNGKIEQLVLRQRNPDEADKKLRPHRTELGLYDLNSQGEIVLREAMSVAYSSGQTEVTEAAGKPAPQFIFPNVGDHDFVNIILDQDSLNALETSLTKISDPLLRQMLWSTIWNMVRHAKLPAQKFVRIALPNLQSEGDLAVLQQGLGYLIQSSWYMNPSVKAHYQPELENFIFNLFKKAKPENPMQIALYNRFITVARTPETLTQIRQWLNQTSRSWGKNGSRATMVSHLCPCKSG